jgi:hypothetical protein
METCHVYVEGGTSSFGVGSSNGTSMSPLTLKIAQTPACAWMRLQLHVWLQAVEMVLRVWGLF